MGPQCQLLGHKCKLTLAAAIWLTGYAWLRNRYERTRSSLAAVQNLPVSQWVLFFFNIMALWPGLGLSQNSNLCTMGANMTQCVLIPTSAVIWIWPLSMSEIFRVSRYIGGPRWWYTCIRPVNTWAYLTWQFCGRVDLTCKFSEAGSQSLDLFSKCVRIIV